MMKIPHPIPYQGSKRWLAATLCQCLPSDVATLYEPFAGSAAFTLAAASAHLAKRYVVSDLHQSLISLWQAIVKAPEELSDAYEGLWHAQKGRERAFYDEVRTAFNRNHDPERFLYLLARCVKAAIRYNAKGEFNNSPDNRRRGAIPATMRWHVLQSSKLLRHTSKISCADFRAATSAAGPMDVIYMDPPYQGVCKDRDARYVKGVGFEDFCEALREMNQRRLSFIISYDGRTGDRQYGPELPGSLDLLRFEVSAGRSTQATLLGRASTTYESLYLSSRLVERLKTLPVKLRHPTSPDEQLELFQGVA